MPSSELFVKHQKRWNWWRSSSRTKFILDRIQRNVKPHEAALTITEDRRDTIFELFNNCREDIEHINSIICEHNGFKDSLLWAVTGRSKVQDLTRTLEGNIGRLKLIMGAITG